MHRGTPGDGGWWNIFQFKCDDAAGVSQPIWTLNVEHDDPTGTMLLYLYSKENTPSSYGQSGAPVVLPAGRWVHLEALYDVATDLTGSISIWQDGALILDVNGVRTALPGRCAEANLGHWQLHRSHRGGAGGGHGYAVLR